MGTPIPAAEDNALKMQPIHDTLKLRGRHADKETSVEEGAVSAGRTTARPRSCSSVHSIQGWGRAWKAVG